MVKRNKKSKKKVANWTMTSVLHSVSQHASVKKQMIFIG